MVCYGLFCLLWDQLSFFKFPGFWMSIFPIFIACKQERRKGCSLDGNCSPGLWFWFIFCLMQYKKQFELQNREKDSQGSVSFSFPSDEGLNGTLEGAIHLPVELVRRRKTHQLNEKGTKWKLQILKEVAVISFRESQCYYNPANRMAWNT